MCGRTACSLGADNLRRACAYRDSRGRQRQPEWIRGERYRPSYNKGPQSSGPVLLSRRHLQQDADSSERVLMDMRWGLVPSWFKKDDPSKMQFNTSNCRSDTMLKKSSYKGALLQGKRCVVLADGFYEWQQQSGGKQPYFIYFPQTKDAVAEEKEGEEEWRGWRLLTMAGIFDCWEPPAGGEMLYTYTIITVDASKDVSFIHHRQDASHPGWGRGHQEMAGLCRSANPRSGETHPAHGEHRLPPSLHLCQQRPQQRTRVSHAHRAGSQEGGQSHPEQQNDAGLVKKLPGGFSPEERK
ncbi:abasic site processing protein HMCES isoform 1-T1 [Alca torda]